MILILLGNGVLIKIHTENGYRCHVTHMWITPFLATLAPWWRFLQCIRRYQDSSERVHLINAVKYTSTIVATFATGLRRIHRNLNILASTSTDIIWILTSMINSSYTSIWDIKMDWGLLQTPSRNFLLRDDLVFYKWVYYVAAPLNVLLRFAWALNTAGLTLHSDILGYITALMEAYRRIQWNFFRLENEHFNNYADYRAINEIPLPFATTIPVEDEEIGKIYSNAIQLLSSDDEAEEERRGLLISESDIASRGRRRTEEEVIEEEHPETQDTGALRLRRPSLISERRYSLPVSARGTKIPRRLQHQQMQRQYTWAHEITSATPTKSGTFYGCRDFEGKREDKKQQDDTSSASAGQRLHEQEDEDLSE
ncbi:EXS family-domain-containing protein [Phascolomyces articulosus]|uniref:EXS family-domain-containing protein n=1 Tax=Phascolomyces articulosus TaxID=60185 RepID=A0AAD5KMM6_9FUNG|nr:EXS family-domain-containing protein [Phascolomyces articulosus]